MNIAILGTGVMGRGWITQFAMHEHFVHCFDENRTMLEGTVAFCSQLADKAARRAKRDDRDIGAKVAGRIATHTTLADFVNAARECDVFLEVIFEDLQLKCRELQRIVPQLPAATYCWSNTSGLDVEILGAASGRPELTIVTHGMNPVPMMAGVEVVPGRRTTAETIEFARSTLLAMNKAPFVAPNIPGFWVNRLLVPQMLDALRWLEQGKIAVTDGDVGLQASLGHPQGTFKLADFVTLPTLLRVAWEMFQATGDPRLYPPQILVRMVKAGDHGAHVGRGFYDWTDSRKPQPRDLSPYQVRNADDLLSAIGSTN